MQIRNDQGEPISISPAEYIQNAGWGSEHVEATAKHGLADYDEEVIEDGGEELVAECRAREAEESAPTLTMANATAACAVCEQGIYQCGHDDQNRPYWLHTSGHRECERFPGAIASPF